MAVVAVACLVGALAAVALLWKWAVGSWRYRHIPGPWAPPIIGNLPSIYAMGMHEYLLQCLGKYGKLFKIFMGSQVVIVTGDPEVSRRLALRNNHRSVNRQIETSARDKAFNQAGLAAANGEAWRTLRLAWQPTFSSDSLEGYCDLMDDGARQLADHLRAKAGTGEVVEMWRALGKMTLAVVGSTAYGVDFHTLPEDGTTDQQADDGRQLQAACQTLFSSLGLRNGSVWQLVNIMFPWSPRLVGKLATTFPDRRFIEAQRARALIRNLSQSLIDKWRVAHAHASPAAPSSPIAAARGCTPAKADQPLVETIDAIMSADAANNAAPARSPTGSASPPSPAPSEAAARADGARALRRASGRGVHPGSFMGLMLATRHKGTGQHLSDDAIQAQSNTFILAGYETTANTLCYCVYSIAAHKGVQERLLQEVDAYGRDRNVAYKDLHMFPYIEAVVRESLRLYPPATLTGRLIADKPYALTPEVTLQPGTPALALLYGYQRSPEYWPEAEAFKPERWLPEGAHLAPTTPDAWTPFGSGARMCIGWRFALQEAKIALVRLYQHQTYELLPGQVPLQLEQNLTLSPKHGVRVYVQPRA